MGMFILQVKAPMKASSCDCRNNLGYWWAMVCKQVSWPIEPSRYYSMKWHGVTLIVLLVKHRVNHTFHKLPGQFTASNGLQPILTVLHMYVVILVKSYL